jgi:hypothetical protein
MALMSRFLTIHQMVLRHKSTHGFSKKHAPALSRMLSYVEGDMAELYEDEGAFAAFVISRFQLQSRNRLGG